MRASAISFAALGACVVVAGSLGGCAAGSTAAEDPSSAPSDGAPLRVERGDLERRVLLSGEVVAEEAAVAAAPIVRIWPLQVRWIAEDGSRVEAGQRVVEFDNAQLASRLEDQRTRVIEQSSKLDEVTARAGAEESSALLELERARAALRKAEIRAELPAGIVSQKELEERRQDLAAARLDLTARETAYAAKRQGGRASIDDARLTLAQGQRDLATTEESLDRLVVRAPRAGILLIGEYWQEPRPIREGDTVWPGMTVARIPDLGTLVVQARLYDVDDGQVAPRARVRAFLDAFPGQPFDGTVRAVERIAQPVASRSLRRAFRVTVDLAAGDRERMRPGMSVRVEVPLLVEDALTAPRAALLWKDAQPHLRLRDGSTVAVRLGACSTTRCVLASGPPAGTALAAGARDGDA
jgi:multidrug resistance efflux pump